MTITLQQLESRLWEAANSLRGPVDPADFKAYVFPILFFKWICDTFDLERAQAVADFGDTVTPEEEADYHRFVVPEGCHWRDVRNTTKNQGVMLGKVLDRLQQANPTKLAGIFGDVAWGNKERLPEASLINLIDTFDSLILNPDSVSHDLLGAAYEYLLEKFADESGKKAGEFFTPREVVRLLVKILAPQPGEEILDPACGSGGMLVETINEVREAGGDTRTLRLYGQEVNLTTAAIARMNLYLHEIEDFQVVRGDTLRDPKFLDSTGGLRKFDVIVANPPFSLKNWGADTWSSDPRALYGVPPAGNGDMAWVQHMVSSMNPKTGRVGVVMPHGVLFRGGIEKEIRQRLIESGRLDAVIGLPPNLFYSTSIPGCLLIFSNKVQKNQHGPVLFVDASGTGTKERNRNRISDENIESILRSYRDPSDSESASLIPTRTVETSEIADNGWDLNISRYLRGVAAHAIDPKEAVAELLQAQDDLRQAESSLAQRLMAGGYV